MIAHYTWEQYWDTFSLLIWEAEQQEKPDSKTDRKGKRTMKFNAFHEGHHGR